MKEKNIYSAPPDGFLICWDNGSHSTDYRDAYGNEFRGTDMLQNAQPFTSEKNAQDWCDEWKSKYPLSNVQTCFAPQDDEIIFKAEIYENDSCVKSMFFSRESLAEKYLDGMKEYYLGKKDQNYGLIQLFAVTPEELDGTDMDDPAALGIACAKNNNLIDTKEFK